MNAPENFLKLVEKKPIKLTLDGEVVVAYEGESILEVAEREGKIIPRLCFTPGYRADGNCRACVVEIEGERVLAPSCCRSVKDGMVVSSESDRSRKNQKLILEMLLADMPDEGFKWNDVDGESVHGELSLPL